MLCVKLLGTPQFNLKAQSLTHALTGRGLALFAYLLVSGKPAPRSTLADLLWQDVTEGQAKEYLRGLLYNLRRTVGDYLLITRQTVDFNRQYAYWLDVEVFNGYLSTNQAAHAPELLPEIMKLYQEDFLDGFSVQNAPIFEAWQLAQRQRLHEVALQGWQQLADYYLAQSQHEQGLAITRRLLALEPWHEEAHRQQMLLLAQSGQRSTALAQYDICCQMLRDELDVSPSAATVALYEQIKADAWPANRFARNTQAATINAKPSIPQRIIRRPNRGNAALLHSEASVPNVQPTLQVDWGAIPQERHFQGRRRELNTLQQWIIGERSRVTMIQGMGGQGKTALAARFVQKLVEDAVQPASTQRKASLGKTPAFERVIWRSLANAPSISDILQDWLQQISGQHSMALPPMIDQQFTLLREYLRNRRFLLVLDNVEGILQNDASGACRIGHEAYGQLWNFFAQRDHQSCLLLTSRIRPCELISLDERAGLLRVLTLDGLTQEDGRQLLQLYNLQGAESAFTALLDYYSGNPLVLKRVAETIDELFDGDITVFWQEETPFFADIGAILEQQFAQLSTIEQELLIWLALESAPVSSHSLWNNRMTQLSKRDFWEGLRALLRRSLIQQQGLLFSLPPLILAYLQDQLVVYDASRKTLPLPHPVLALDIPDIKGTMFTQKLALQTLNLVEKARSPVHP